MPSLSSLHVAWGSRMGSPVGQPWSHKALLLLWSQAQPKSRVREHRHHLTLWEMHVNGHCVYGSRGWGLREMGGWNGCLTPAIFRIVFWYNIFLAISNNVPKGLRFRFHRLFCLLGGAIVKEIVKMTGLKRTMKQHLLSIWWTVKKTEHWN